MNVNGVNQGFVCRLCFKVIEGKFEEINEITIEIFDVLLLNVNLDFTENPILCRNCAYSVRKSFDFKSLCVDTEKIISSFIVDKSEDIFNLKDIYNLRERQSEEAISDGDFDICRFCLKPLQCNFLPIEKNKYGFMEMSLYMPEMDLTISKNPIICMSCKENSQSYLDFVRLCSNMAERIAGAYRDNRIASQLKSETELDELGIKNEDYVTTESTESLSHTVSPKTEGYKFQCTKCSYKTKYEVYLKKHTPKCGNEKIYTCEICLFQTKIKRCFKRHIVNHKDPLEIVWYRCEWCAFVTKYKSYLKSHLVQHKELIEIKKYKCTSCAYETNRKRDLVVHMRTHKEVEMYRCTLCTFETKYKGQLKTHAVIHRDTSKTKKYKCKCGYETMRSYRYEIHMLTHKDESEAGMYRRFLQPKITRECHFKGLMSRHEAYESNYENNYSVRTVVTEEGSRVEKYKCDTCPYETIQEKHIKIHARNHKTVSQARIYPRKSRVNKKAKQVNPEKHTLTLRDASQKYIRRVDETNDKEDIQSHMATHEGTSKVDETYGYEIKDDRLVSVDAGSDMRRCYKCMSSDYKSKDQKSVVAHVTANSGEECKCGVSRDETPRDGHIKSDHKNTSKFKTFKCETCPFKTTRPVDMRRHMLCHEYPYDGKMYKCETCTYQTKRINNLTQHMTTHKASEVLTYKCMMCAYESNDKRGIQSHMTTHDASKIGEMYEYQIKREDELTRSRETTRVYKCAICSYETKRKSNLTVHSLVHKDAAGGEIFKCARCSYQTKRKDSLRRHVGLHGPASMGKRANESTWWYLHK